MAEPAKGSSFCPLFFAPASAAFSVLYSPEIPSQRQEGRTRMDKTLVVGDVHLKQEIILPRVEAAARAGVTRIVFLGDYCDEWHATDRQTLEALGLFADWTREMRGAGTDVVLLLGNHDLQYLMGEPGPGTRASIMGEVREALLSLKLKAAETIGCFLATHAGVTQTWADRFLDSPTGAEGLAAQLNGLYARNAFAELSACGPGRGGMSVPGPLWADAGELWSDAARGVDQIVGHSPVRSCEPMGAASAMAGVGSERIYLCDTFSLTSSMRPIGDASMLLVEGASVEKTGLRDGGPSWEDAVERWLR